MSNHKKSKRNSTVKNESTSRMEVDESYQSFNSTTDEENLSAMAGRSLRLNSTPTTSNAPTLYLRHVVTPPEPSNQVIVVDDSGSENLVTVCSSDMNNCKFNYALCNIFYLSTFSFNIL